LRLRTLLLPVTFCTPKCNPMQSDADSGLAAIPSTLKPAPPPKATVGKETQKEIQWM